jgi:alkaline phosphatase
MKRRDFFRNSTLATAFLSTTQSFGHEQNHRKGAKAKNIIFMVSDGMSTGTLNMADLLRQRKEGRSSNWLGLYRDNRVRRALMDTASASSLITDSAAASSAWGGGVRVPNGALNVSANGEEHRPILQKFKAAGKAVGCVTTVPITHATPAGFCVNSKSRGSQGDIALQYLSLRFDVMMGGGTEFFSDEKRIDKKDVFGQFKTGGYQVVTNRAEMLAVRPGSPVLGVFHEDGLPYALDRENDEALKSRIPSLADMTATAISQMQGNANGFVLQVEGGKVDWGAHANDAGAMLYDQLAFDDAVRVAIDFADKNKDTLVVLTTDHGNSDPALLYGSHANQNFDRLHTFRHTNNRLLTSITSSTSPAQLVEQVQAAQGIVLTADEARGLLSQSGQPNEHGLYNPSHLPYRSLAQLQQPHTSVGWAGMDHTADFVELAMLGPGSELLTPLVKNADLHNLLLTAAEVSAK